MSNIYVPVEDIDAALGRIKQSDGKALMPKTAIEVVADPERLRQLDLAVLNV